MNLREAVWKASGLDRQAAKPCACADSVPMPHHQDTDQWTVGCCFCWTETAVFKTPELALAAWNAGERVPHHDDEADDELESN